MIKICEFCGEKYEVDDGRSNSARRMYCSYECRYKGNNRRNRHGAPLLNLVCTVCGKVYLANRSDSVTCSLECRHERNKQLAKERYQKAHWDEQRFLEQAEKSKPKRRSVTPAHEIEAEARKRGMNYGQYYALMLQKQEIEERERRKESNK